MSKDNAASGSPFLKELQIEADKGRYDLITTDNLWGLYQKDPNLLLVDVRESHAYQNSHIKGAINFPMKPTLWSRIKKRRSLQSTLGPNKKRHIVFY